MAVLRCCSYNCRGWNSGVITLNSFIDSLDICFVQEHWLASNLLHKVGDVSSDFLCVGVSGMDDSCLLIGRPYGGCSILYRKSLSSCITPLHTCSSRFCAIKLCDLSGSSILLVNVYLPSEGAASCYSEYLNTLGELEGFIDSQQCDQTLIAGDFNVDFVRGGPLASLLVDFVSDRNYVVHDLLFQESVIFTYERDDGLVRSWIDHIMCSQSLSSLVTDVHTLKHGTNLSDHLPLLFLLHINCSSVPISLPSAAPKPAVRVDLSKATQANIMKYRDMISARLSDPPAAFMCCSQPDCSTHNSLLDNYAEHIMLTLLDCAYHCFPCRSPSSKRVAGWHDKAGKLKEASNFWYRVWMEAGCPSAGVLSSIKKQAKKRYKYEVRRLKRRQQYHLRDQLAQSFAMKRKDTFWSDIKRLKNSRASQISPLVDRLSDSSDIANNFASRYSALLNTHSSASLSSLQSSVQSSLTSSCLNDVTLSEDHVAEAIAQLKSNKSDSSGVTSEHIKFASSVIAYPLSLLFTAILRHGYMPKCFRDSVLVPIPKGNKDASVSSNYRPIALSSSFSKILERLILSQYRSFLSSNALQFGFKPGHSTTLCSATIKNVITRYTQNGSPVLGCFLDASKAFDLVDHTILFNILLNRGLPLVIVRFLVSWYNMQKMQVRWDLSLSLSFSVSNGVRQGSVLSPYLFAVYLDSLLVDLSNSGVGCYWGGCFAGAFAYADDVVLLAPCASALRRMLQICSSFAISHKLAFNADKTQLTCFYAPSVRPITPFISFNGTQLTYSDEVIHLGHVLTSTLDDTADILRAVKDMNRKMNSLLCLFYFVDPHIKTFLLQSYCLALYGCCLWSLNAPSIHLIEVALNKALRKIWHLPPWSRTAVVHCVAQVPSISTLLYHRSQSFLLRALSSSSPLVRTIFNESVCLINFFSGYNFWYGHKHVRIFHDVIC